jgi:hypothetical protein
MLTNMTLSAATSASRRPDQARRSSPPWRYRRPERPTGVEGPLLPAVLIYGSAIKTRANSPGFTNMQFSNRRQTGGLTIEIEEIRPNGALSKNLLIATFTKLESESSHCKPARYQNSNRNKIAVSANVARVFRPEAFPPKLGFSPLRMLLCLRQPNEAIIAESA